jgi:hypothetical protein
MLVVIILLWLAPLVTSKPSRRRRESRRESTHFGGGGSRQQQIYNARNWCETANETCASMIAEESLNCIFECVSPNCFAEIYGKEPLEPGPLEPGEVDIKRAQEFEDCASEQLRQARREQRQEQERD